MKYSKFPARYLSLVRHEGCRGTVAFRDTAETQGVSQFLSGSKWEEIEEQEARQGN